jgi:hypothetical protein
LIGTAADPAAGEEEGAGVVRPGIVEFITKVPLGSPFLFRLLLRSDWSWRYAWCPYGTCTAVWTFTEVARSALRVMILKDLVESSTISKTTTFSDPTPAVAATLEMNWASNDKKADLVISKMISRITRTVSGWEQDAGCVPASTYGKNTTSLLCIFLCIGIP